MFLCMCMCVCVHRFIHMKYVDVSHATALMKWKFILCNLLIIESNRSQLDRTDAIILYKNTHTRVTAPTSIIFSFILQIPRVKE